MFTLFKSLVCVTVAAAALVDASALSDLHPHYRLIPRSSGRYSAGSPPAKSQQFTSTSLSTTSSSHNCPSTPSGGWSGVEGKYAFLSTSFSSSSESQFCGQKLAIVRGGRTVYAVMSGTYSGSSSTKKNLRVAPKVASSLGGTSGSISWFFLDKDVQAAALKASGSSSSGGGGGTTVYKGGVATYFYQNGVAGACGHVHKDSDKVVALDYRMYGNVDAVSKDCGRQVKITRVGTDRSVVATVADACPSCRSQTSLDLSVGAFTEIATEREGEVPITWYYIT